MDALKRLVMSKEGKSSLTKIGGWIVAQSGFVLTLPSIAHQIGIEISLPKWLSVLALFVAFQGGGTVLAGLRDLKK